MTRTRTRATQQFPDNYWSPNVAIYLFYEKFFNYGDKIFDINLEPPPREGDELLDEVRELLEMQADEEERNRRNSNILAEQSEIPKRYYNDLLISPSSHPRTAFLMAAMNEIALAPVMHYKKRFKRPRPNQIEPRIDPMIDVPGHPA
jgi:hypothetical protein